MGDSRPAEIQTAYQILAASHPDLLDMDEGDFWDTGRVESRQTVLVEYDGKSLISSRRLWWKVRSFDSDGLPGPWSDSAFFEAGLFDVEDWRGRWICANLQGSRVARVPLPVFTRAFDLPGEVRSARLYVAALGDAAIQVNGHRQGKVDLPPNWVDYSKRVEYLTLDVGDSLRAGSNSISIVLADGCYAGNLGIGHRQQYGDKPWLLIQLNVSLADGEQRQFYTDSMWRWQPSWILGADPVAGESVAGSQIRPDWAGDTEQIGWYPVAVGERPEDLEIELTAAEPAELSDPEEIAGELICWREESSTALFGFPQPVMGRVRVELLVPDGAAIKIRYGLEVDAALELEGPVSEDVYTAIGLESGEIFEALFSQHGFKYVEISGEFYSDSAVKVFGRSVGRPVLKTGTFLADHPRLNQLHGAMVGELVRLRQSFPLARLSADGRLNTVAEFGAAIGGLMLNLSAATLATRWLRDMADSQFAQGGFPSVVPLPPGEEVLGAEGPAGSSDAFIEVLWQLYRHCGDRQLLRRNYPAVRQMLDRAVAGASAFVREDLDSDKDYPGDLAATAWLYRSAHLASRIAGVLGNLTELEDCEELASSVRSAFRRRFVTPDGRVLGDNIEVYALTLGFGLLERSEQALAARTLFRACDLALAGGDRADHSLLEVPHLLRTLTQFGRLDLAYRVALGTSAAPDCNGRKLLGAGVSEWLFNTLAGFELSRELSERKNAFRHMVVHPRPLLGVVSGPYAGEPPVREVEAALMTINGRYETRWRVTDHEFELSLLVPGNCSADVILPDDSRHQVDAGVHSFSMAFGEAGDGIPVLREVS
ncbi:MAG: family 78 glycoside hydrolase catalytic domain [Pseudomonadales bacterium]